MLLQFRFRLFWSRVLTPTRTAMPQRLQLESSVQRWDASRVAISAQARPSRSTQRCALFVAASLCTSLRRLSALLILHRAYWPPSEVLPCAVRV
jgi:hypothetical protein